MKDIKQDLIDEALVTLSSNEVNDFIDYINELDAFELYLEWKNLELYK
jgi:hypothetical protein